MMREPWQVPEEQAHLTWQEWLVGTATLVGAALALGVVVQLLMWLSSLSS